MNSSILVWVMIIFAAGRRMGAYCSGNNHYEQTGQPYGNGQKRPWQPVEGLTGVTDLSVGQYHACAVDGSNQILCWGNEDSWTFRLGAKTFPAIDSGNLPKLLVVQCTL